MGCFGSATVFFAYIGFDSVASTAEEVKNPQRDLPWGASSLSVCCFLYMMVSVVVVGMVLLPWIQTHQFHLLSLNMGCSGHVS
ncbi:cationic amino acid transporter 3, mitochondrial-like [Iris pallida]|uniref:Cationic amino acid transporter 3, mitochondrial-like n=1 Tax=Iris pallida TaxID=29817 RepID=A0AAX6DK90_IRIPA|nr:cationic amino acid transporter 3, mitochondrial-like [Iris pallida]